MRKIASLFAVCLSLVLAAWLWAKPRPVPYEVHTLPIHNVTAATFGPSDSELTLAVARGGPHDWDPSATVPAAIEVVNFRTGKVVTSNAISLSNTPTQTYHLSYIDGGKELALIDDFDLRILNAADYREVARIPVGGPLPGPPPWEGKQIVDGAPVIYGYRPAEIVTRAAFSADGKKLAALLRTESASVAKNGSSVASPNYSGFYVRTYALPSREEERKWSFKERGIVTGFAISPSGNRIAWSRFDEAWTVLSQGTWWIRRARHNYVPRGVDNIQILDVATGKIVGIHTDDVAGSLAFASDRRLLSISANGALPRHDGDGIRAWDAETGKLLGETHSKPRGVHHTLAVSLDGRVVVGFVGQEKENENFVDPDKNQFRLWSPSSWDVLFTSPVLPSVYNRYTGPPLFTLSSDGHSVLVWEPSTSQPLTIFHIPSWE